MTLLVRALLGLLALGFFAGGAQAACPEALPPVQGDAQIVKTLNDICTNTAAATSHTGTNSYQATASAPISISTATTTEIVAISGTKAIYISHIDFISGGTGNVTLEYGSGTACATGTTVLSGPYGLLTGSGLSAGNGVAPFLFVPAGKTFCILTSANVQLSGAVSYAQF